MKPAIKAELEAVQDALKSTMAGLIINARRLALMEVLLNTIDTESLSDDVTFNAFGGSMWISLKSRADLEILFRLAERWDKKDDADCIRYSATVMDVEFVIRAYDNALPPTCRVVEEQIAIPARMETRKRIVCNQPTPEPTPATNEILQ